MIVYVEKSPVIVIYLIDSRRSVASRYRRDSRVRQLIAFIVIDLPSFEFPNDDNYNADSLVAYPDIPNTLNSHGENEW